MITGILLLQVALSTALFLVLWRFLTPIINQFTALVDERDSRTGDVGMEDSQFRAEIRRLTAELQQKQQDQRARGAREREGIIEVMRREAEAAHDSAAQRATLELDEFRAELAKLKEGMRRDVEQESNNLSQLILERVGKGSGMNPNPVH